MTSPDDKKRSRGMSRDMSPEAISRRLRIVSDLRILCLKLGGAKKLELERTSTKEWEGSERPADADVR